MSEINFYKKLEISYRLMPFKYISIDIDDKQFHFKFNKIGNFSFTKFSPKNKKVISEFDYFDCHIKIKSINESFPFGFYRVIKLSKIYTLIYKKLYFLVYKKFQQDYTYELLNSIKKHFDMNTYINFLIEIELGSFEENILVDDFEIETLADEFIELSDKFYTHVVGTKYHQNSKNVNISDNVFLVWEDENRFDSNAVVVLNKKMEKIGYIRRTISPFLVKKLKEKAILQGKILYISEEDIFIEVSL